MPFCHPYCLVPVACLATVLLPVTPALAQLELIPDTASDRSLGTQIIQNGLPGGDFITGGTRSQSGQNLFHSFQEFNVRENRSVYFQNPTGVQNILTRVTGNNPSNILGTLGVVGSANLFLLNSNGIIFGPSARLDIRGSFFATTANSLKFPDGSEFDLTNLPSPSLLTVNITPGLQSGTISPGSTLINRGELTAGQDLVLEGDRLDLQGQLVAGRDLTLKAQNTVLIRDTATTPFLARSGRDLTLQGNQGIDILALQHPQTPFQSGRNLSLLSDGIISGDAHFASGGAFQVRSLSGQLATFTSLYDPIISSTGNVDIAASYGAVGAGAASLLIESQGSVRIQGDVIIEAPDTVSAFVGDDVVLSSQPGLIIRSGQANLVYPNNLNTPPPDFTADPLPEDGITVLGAVRVQPTDQGGVVKLTAANGNITFNYIDTSNSTGGNGGSIELTAKGSISNTGSFTSSNPEAASGPIALGSFSYSDIGDSNTGGSITLTAIEGRILLQEGGSAAYSVSTSGNSGTGGAISFRAAEGILLFNSASDSYSRSGTPGFIQVGNSGGGGAISLTTTNGNIVLFNSPVQTFSSSSLIGDSGSGGTIALSATNGEIVLFDSSLGSFSSSRVGNSDAGGAISFTVTNGDISLYNSTLSSVTRSGSTFRQTGNSNSGPGGAISFTATNGNISLSDSSLFSSSGSTDGTSGLGGSISLIATNGYISLLNSRLFSDSSSAPTQRAAGSGGAISMTATQDISFSNSSLFSNSFSNSFSDSLPSGGSGTGGAISLTSNTGNILLENVDLQSYSYTGSGASSGTGGAIRLSAQAGTIVGNASTLLNSFSVSTEGGSGDGGTVTLEAGSEISGLAVTTIASGGQSGNVQINGFGNLLIDRTNILTAQTVEVKQCVECDPIVVNLSGKGQAGNVVVDSIGNLTFSNSQIQSDTRSGNAAGNIAITSSGLIKFNNSQVIGNTSSSGQAGNVAIKAGQDITLTDGSQLSATTSSTGNAGSITLDTPVLTVAGDAQIIALTTGAGQGGSITVNAPVAVNLTRVQNAFPVLSVEADGAGRAGDILINTPSLTLSDLARITATATAKTTNNQGGGSIILNASNVNLAGTVGVFAETQGQAPAGTLTLKPYLNQPDLSITLTPNSQISASTSGTGNGGDLLVSAPQSITVSGPGKLAVETNSTGNAGNMIFITGQLLLTDGVDVSASSRGAGNAGNISIRAQSLILDRGAKLSTNTTSSGQAGDLTVNVTDLLTLSGTGTGLFASTTLGSTGNGGNIRIDPRAVLIQNAATIQVNSQGRGTGGSISLQTEQLELRNRGSITAETASAQGGNITLEVRDAILLRRNSLISATAGTAQAAGDGGNINIRTPFIIGVLGENSDITANAFTGRGGNINITTNAIFGLLPQPRLTPLSDITASSAFGLSGTISINSLNVDPNRGLVALPTRLSDPSNQIRQECIPYSQTTQKNSFFVTGRGGLPTNPESLMTGDRPLVNLVSPISVNSNRAKVFTESPEDTGTRTLDPEPKAIVEAQAWVQGEDGGIYLIASADTTALQSLRIDFPACGSQR